MAVYADGLYLPHPIFYDKAKIVNFKSFLLFGKGFRMFYGIGPRILYGKP